MLSTPSTSHVSFDNIYEPAEDSYLLLDTLSTTEVAFLTSRFPTQEEPPQVLEVGVGSGVVLAFVAANANVLFGRSSIAAFGTDINPLATEAAKRTVETAIAEADDGTAEKPKLIEISVSDLASAHCENKIDVLIFNPPYVPTESLPSAPHSAEAEGSQAVFERDSKLLELSYAGGVDGMETTNRLLTQLPQVLSARGVAYVLFCAQNKPEQIKAKIHAWPGSWHAETVGTSGKKAGWEKLCIIRIWRNTG